jgi:hypothetical protein
MFCTSLAKEEGAFVLDSVFRWSLGDGFLFFFAGAATASVLAEAAEVASAAFLRTAASSAEAECTEGRLRAVGAKAEAADFFEGLFCACIGAAFNFDVDVDADADVDVDVDVEERAGFVRSLTGAADFDD